MHGIAKEKGLGEGNLISCVAWIDDDALHQSTSNILLGSCRALLRASKFVYKIHIAFIRTIIDVKNKY
jgi:hypothetical protein